LIENGIWGDWKTRQDAPISFYLCGFVFSEENSWGNLGIDGLKAIFCDSQNWNSQQQRQLNPAHNTAWKTSLCPLNSYIVALQIRFVDDQGVWSDDSAI
jgi:hypothetical protein